MAAGDGAFVILLLAMCDAAGGSSGALDHAAGLLPLHLVPQPLFLSLVVDDVTVGHVLFPLTHSGWCGVSSR
jgi:hypothetical protein